MTYYLIEGDKILGDYKSEPEAIRAARVMLAEPGVGNTKFAVAKWSAFVVSKSEVSVQRDGPFLDRPEVQPREYGLFTPFSQLEMNGLEDAVMAKPLVDAMAEAIEADMRDNAGVKSSRPDRIVVGRKGYRKPPLHFSHIPPTGHRARIIAGEYRDGFSFRALTKAHRIGPQHLSAILAANGVKPRTRNSATK